MLKRAAIASFSGSLLRRTGRSFSFHPQRFNSSGTIRSALASTVSEFRLQAVRGMEFRLQPVRPPRRLKANGT